jgi:hypothetical protein
MSAWLLSLDHTSQFNYAAMPQNQCKGSDRISVFPGSPGGFSRTEPLPEKVRQRQQRGDAGAAAAKPGQGRRDQESAQDQRGGGNQQGRQEQQSAAFAAPDEAAAGGGQQEIIAGSRREGGQQGEPSHAFTSDISRPRKITAKLYTSRTKKASAQIHKPIFTYSGKNCEK